MTTFPLRSLRLRPGEEHREDVPVELAPFVLGGQPYVPEPSLVEAGLAIQRATTGDVYRLALTASLHGPCMRCLGDAVCRLPIDAREYQGADHSAVDDLRCAYVVDDRLDLSAWAHDELADALPDQIVCRPDCAGLCGVCGKNLNDEPHVHEEEAVDTRWAALEALRGDVHDESGTD